MNASTNEKYDVCVIGCGSGGFAAAMRALDFGKRVCLIESHEIGGAGVKWGALASKTMWELAKDYAVASKMDRGYRSVGLSVDYPAVRATVLTAVREKQAQILHQLAACAPGKWPGPGFVTFKRGWASFVDDHTVRVEGAGGSSEDVQADHFLIATGSSPRPATVGTVDQQRIVDSDGVLQLNAFPRRLMIIGAGVTGCEYATIFANFGQTQVYLVDHKKRILPAEDPDISDYVSHHLAQRGVHIFHSANLQNIDNTSDELKVTLAFEDAPKQTIAVDVVLFSIGRAPNLKRLNLDKLGLFCDQRGYLPIDADCRVHKNIYAAGDVTRHPNLVNMAEKEGRYAVKHMFRQTQWPLNYDNMSTIMFFYPEVAAVGLNETMCRKKKIAYRVAYYANRLLSRAIAMRAATGFVKIIVSDDEDLRLLGMRAAGPQVSSTIIAIAMMMDQNKGLKDIYKTVYPHPSMCEGIHECLRLLLGKSLYKPNTFPDLLKIYHWHPDGGYRNGY